MEMYGLSGLSISPSGLPWFNLKQIIKSTEFQTLETSNTYMWCGKPMVFNKCLPSMLIHGCLVCRHFEFLCESAVMLNMLKAQFISALVTLRISVGSKCHEMCYR